MAGQVQIAAFGELSDSLIADPSFSFFTKRYSKHTNHANENFKITFPEKVHTNDQLRVVIPQNHGDILQEITLSFVVDPNNVQALGSNLYPVDVFGISVIDYVELYAGKELIDRVTGDDIFIDRELNTPESYRSSVDVLHGKHFQGSSDREFLQEFYDGQYSVQGIDPFTTDEYRIKIPFYFHNRPTYGLPLCALYKQELSLVIKLRPSIDVLFATKEKFGETLWDPRADNLVSEELELTDFKVNLDLVHLNVTERCMLQNKPMDILFEQRQRNTFLIDSQSKVGNFKLDFKNCVKEIFFIAKKTGRWTNEHADILDQLQELDNYTEAQLSSLTILKLIPVWGGIATVTLDTIVGETDVAVRRSIVDTIREMFYWGETSTYTDLLDALEIQSSSDQAHVDTLKTYINGIPVQIATIQSNVNSNLATLEGETNPVTRSTIIDNNLLSIPNLWGSDQVGILNLLRTPSLPTEGLLIFTLRVYLTTASYYLTGLGNLKPGTTEQVTIVDNITRYLDNAKYEYDVIKFGLGGVVDAIPGKNAYTRGIIVDILLKLGSTTWGSTEISLLEILREDPFSDADKLATQTGAIDDLNTFLSGVTIDNTTRLRIKGLIGSPLSARTGIIQSDFPGSTTQQRADLVTIIREIPIWEDSLIKSLNNYVPGQDPSLLIGNLQGKLGLIPTLKFRLNILKLGINGILDTLPATAVDRDPILLSLSTLHTWSETGFYYINALRTPSGSDQVYIDGLKDEGNQAQLSFMDRYTQFEQKNVIDGIIGLGLWGEYYFNLNELRNIQPGFIGETNCVTTITTHLGTLGTEFGYIVDGIEFTLNNLPTTEEERTPIINSIKNSANFWTAQNLTLLDTLKVPGSPNEATVIAGIINEFNTFITDLDSYIGFLSPLSILTISEIDTLQNSGIYLQESELTVLDTLRTLVTIRGPSGTPTSTELFYKNVLNLFTQTIRFYWKNYRDGILTTIPDVTAITDINLRDSFLGTINELIVNGLVTLDTPSQNALLELAVIGSQNHTNAVDVIITHLTTLESTIQQLITDVAAGQTTAPQLQDNSTKVAAWGGYFYNQIELLKNASIVPATETEIINELVTHVDITSSSESRTENIKNIITPIKESYPKTIFNKWVRAKKNVPLMYSKQKNVKFECDGSTILDETTGSNMFMSASLPNMYHKRSPNFRNINICSFALYPSELRPSGHLNFSTVKDANVKLELEYDGAHGTFDFDDNYIEVFNIDRIYFPKQIIIIAKSYNMMIIRDGEARITY